MACRRAVAFTVPRSICSTSISICEQRERGRTVPTAMLRQFLWFQRDCKFHFRRAVHCCVTSWRRRLQLCHTCSLCAARNNMDGLACRFLLLYYSATRLLAFVQAHEANSLLSRVVLFTCLRFLVIHYLSKSISRQGRHLVFDNQAALGSLVKAASRQL